MVLPPHALPLACAASGVAWAVLAARRTGPGAWRRAARALLGGLAAVFLASAAYDLLAAAGLAATWDALASGGAASLAAGGTVGLVEEGAKLAGLLLALERGARRRDALACAVGVCAGFAALEAAIALHGVAAGPALARAALAPVAHVALFAPAALAVAATRRSRLAWAWLPLALAASAALHGAGDLSLALPRFGRLGYAAALLAPVLAIWAAARVRARTTAPAPRTTA